MSSTSSSIEDCNKYDRWSGVVSLDDISKLGETEMQIFTLHAVRCPYHEALVENFEDKALGFLEEQVAAGAGFGLQI